MKLIILDRDGVINFDSDNYIKSPDEWTPIPGSLEAIAQLNHAGFIVAVATNQSGIARGYYDVATLNAMHNKMHQLLQQSGGQVDAVFYCPHGPDDGCNCRKPLPGMLKQIAERYGADLADCYFIGDNTSDIDAANNAGCHFALVRTGKGQKVEAQLVQDHPELSVFDDLAEFVNWFLQQ